MNINFVYSIMFGFFSCIANFFLFNLIGNFHIRNTVSTLIVCIGLLIAGCIGKNISSKLLNIILFIVTHFITILFIVLILVSDSLSKMH